MTTQLSLARDDFFKHKYSEALVKIDELENHLPASLINLSRSYVLREQQNINGSNQYLEKACEGLNKNDNVSLNVEIYLNQALNAYLLHDDVLLADFLDKCHDNQNKYFQLLQSIRKCTNKTI